ncbi:hypothetical protein [Tenacibaculum phage PTm5]|uniref:Uncharacterized protein n=2 Tax=Shirahamavirus PTm1 TaxID=2846435 RepID=A0A5S9BZF5_9CAUD|nr:hypothetical protein [Tenacibaculum phage PTm5]
MWFGNDNRYYYLLMLPLPIFAIFLRYVDTLKGTLTEFDILKMSWKDRLKIWLIKVLG